MKDFLTWIVQLFRDQRGAVGDDDSADDSPEKDDKGNQDVTEDKGEEDDELTLDLSEVEEEEDKDKDKDKDKSKKSEEVEELRSEIETLEEKHKEKEKEWKRQMYQARKDREERTKAGADKTTPLTDSQLEKLLEDANTEGDTKVQLNVLKYLAQQISQGEAKEAVNAAEMSRKSDNYRGMLEERFPDIGDPNSDMRLDIDRVKADLNVADHPYGDMFAVGYRLFEDMDALIEASFEAGKEEGLKGTADEKRKQEIKAKALPSSKKSPYKKTHGLTESQLETAKQMGLKPEQLPAYSKLVGKRPRTVSVEG